MITNVKDMNGSATGDRFDRDAAMAARPIRMQSVRVGQRDNGGMLVTVTVRRPGWQRWFGGSEHFDRTFGLDAFGCEVYEACDGRTRVAVMIGDFAKRHSVGSAEAEMSVTRFLKTLITKGLVAMEVDRSETT